MKKPKLLFINPAQFGYSAGYFHYCMHLQENYEIIFITFDQGMPRIDLPGVKVIYSPYGLNKVPRLINFFREIFFTCTTNQIDILFTVYFKFCFLLSIFAKSKVKLLDIRSGELGRLGNVFIWSQSLFFKHIVILSEGLRLKLGIVSRKCLILSLGAEIYYNGEHDYSTFNLLYVGSLNYRNIDQTIDGLSLFLNMNEDYKKKMHYYIIGFGSAIEEAKILFTIERSDIQQNITLIGRKQYQDLYPYFEKCNIGIAYVPINDFYEFQPTTKIFEYVLSGLYCIATNTYENRKLITKENGVLCEDNASGFAKALKSVTGNAFEINSTVVRSSLKKYEWKNLIENHLLPHLKKIQNN